ncbi:MAG: LysE/ArgO family amino acid transporter [Desulfovibrio sp.]
MLSSYIQGFAMGGGLIIAIGAQNAFVLTQGVKRNHHIPVALLCIAIDVICISIGISGIGALVAANPTFNQIALWGGAAFLFMLGIGSFRSAMKGGQLRANEEVETSLKRTLILTLGVSLLNPHLYLDTVVLMGSISSKFAMPERYYFGFGAITASAIWFVSLGFFGQALSPLFKRQRTWQALDVVIGCSMWAIAATLIKTVV